MAAREVSFLLATVAISIGCSDASETKVGRTEPNFGQIGAGWEPHVYSLVMDDIWQNGAAIDRQGTNYYLMPKPEGTHTCSERFDPSSKYFQSWFGTYTVKDNANGTYAVGGGQLDAAAVVKLAMADQASWLQAYGATASLTVSADSTPFQIANVTIDGTNGWKLTGNITSNVDVGDNNEIVAGWADALGTVDVALWTGKVSSYQIVTLNVVCYVWHAPENQELNVVYYNGVTFADLSGGSHVTLSELEGELDAMARAVTVYQSQ